MQRPKANRKLGKIFAPYVTDRKLIFLVSEVLQSRSQEGCGQRQEMNTNGLSKNDQLDS